MLWVHELPNLLGNNGPASSGTEETPPLLLPWRLSANTSGGGYSCGITGAPERATLLEREIKLPGCQKYAFEGKEVCLLCALFPEGIGEEIIGGGEGGKRSAAKSHKNNFHFSK